MSENELQRYIDLYGRDIYSFCKYLTGNREEADDLYQDVWLKVTENVSKLDAFRNVRSFCLTVAAGLWKNRVRKFAWRSRIAPQTSLESSAELYDIPSEAQSSEETVIERETEERVRQFVSELPERYKLIVLLYYMEELSVDEIAVVIKKPIGTVKSRLYHARKLLKERMEPYEQV